MEFLVYIVAVVAIYLIAETKAKIDFYKLRNASNMLEAEVIEYRKEKVNIRNDYTRIYYPYARILNDEQHFDKNIRVRYANSWYKPFKIGERINVFWNNGELFYWNAMDHGINSILPNKWPWA